MLALSTAGSRGIAQGQSPAFQGFPQDWSQRHLIFSDPGTLVDAVRENSVAHWMGIKSDFRYLLQQARHDRTGAKALLIGPEPPPRTSSRPHAGNTAGDWAMLPGSGAVGGAKVTPAKFGFATTTASCTDFVVFPSGVAGSATVPSIVAYYNLYTGCGGAVPNVMSAVNLDGGKVVTSPVLSIDGTQVAFVATIGTAAYLVVLKLPSSSTVPVAQITSSSATINASSPCTAPCAYYAAFSGSNADSNSSPFYDYINNVIYVGDDKGVLHKFQNVFGHYLYGPANTTAPSEVTTAPWPVTVSSGNMLTSPVYDSVASKIFVGTGAGLTLASVTVSGSTAAVVQSASIGAGSGSVVTDPIVDINAGYVYITVSHGGATTSGTTDTKQPYLYQFGEGFGASGLPSGAEPLSPASSDVTDTAYIYGAAFDNNYLSSANQTGNIYSCGLNASKLPELYRIPISANHLSAPTAGPVLTSSTTALCSPITEVYNNGTDYIFLSQTGTNVTTAPVGCPSGTGCLMSFNVTNGSQTFSSSAPATIAQSLQTSGTSGIVVDNTVSSPTGTSQIYFTALGSQSCVRTVIGSDAIISETITATTGVFTAGDVGASITGTGFFITPTIETVNSSTSVTVNLVSLSSNSGVSFTVTDTGRCAVQVSQALLR